jgi:ketosteroid isomerase-like protein
MKTTLIIILICLPIFCLNTCSSKPEELSKADMKKIVDENNQLLKEYFQNQDIEKLANLYSDSAKLSPNGSGFVIGRDSIRAFWAEDFKTSKVLDMQTNTLTIDGNSLVIYETGKATSKIMYMDTLYTPTVKYINVWVKQPNGKYLLDIDFWNRDVPKKN